MSDSIKAGGLRIYKGAVAIVTGGASGIGGTFAVELAARGATVIIADIDGELAEQRAAEIRERGGEATHSQLDVSDHAAVKSLVEQTASRHGRLDFLFNLVAIIYTGTVLDHTIEDWNRILDVGIRGVVNGIEAAYPIMVKQGFGHIVNMSSTAGLVPFYNVPYTASRFAVVGMTLTLRQEASLSGVRVTLLCPGAVQTLTFSGSGKFSKHLSRLSPEKFQAATKQLRPVDPIQYVHVALRGIVRNRPMIVAPFKARYIWRSYRQTPFLTSRLMFNRFVKPLLLEAKQTELTAAEPNDQAGGSPPAGGSST